MFANKNGCDYMKLLNGQCGRRREKVFSSICIVPSLVGVLIFFLIPFGIVVYYSLINNPVMKDYVGLENYKALMQKVDDLKGRIPAELRIQKGCKEYSAILGSISSAGSGTFTWTGCAS